MKTLFTIFALLFAVPAAAQANGFVVRSILPIKGPMKHGAWHWDESRAPKAGPIVITVDTAAQVVSVFRNGHEIGAAVILYGSDEKPTPMGVFPILQKQARYFSRTYGGAPMPYMQRLTNDGVAIHGSDVRVGYATHGCVGVPTAFAAKLFAVTKLGDRVIVTNGKRMALGDQIIAN